MAVLKKKIRIILKPNLCVILKKTFCFKSAPKTISGSVSFVLFSSHLVVYNLLLSTTVKIFEVFCFYVPNGFYIILFFVFVLTFFFQNGFRNISISTCVIIRAERNKERKKFNNNTQWRLVIVCDVEFLNFFYLFFSLLTSKIV